jgi:phosphoglycerate kinase
MRVLLRASLNVPTKGGKVVNDFRLKPAAEMVRFLVARGARVVVLGHLGRTGDSLRPVAEALGTLMPDLTVTFRDLSREDMSSFEAPADARTVTVLENVRRFPGEEMNDESLARSFSLLGDIFVNDAFSDAHRAHASVVGITKFLPSYAGFCMEREVAKLSEALTPSHPALAIIGGAKFETKEPLIERLLTSYDRVCVGGALVNDFFKACGYPIGTSLFSNGVPKEELRNSQRLELPNDIAVERGGLARTTVPTDVRADERIVDAGPSTGRRWAQYVTDASFVLFNGPLGVYEQGFTDETEAIAQAIASSKARAVVGGGDTVAALSRQHFDPERVFLSTGGGAMLQFLADGTLVGLEPLKQ